MPLFHQQNYSLTIYIAVCFMHALVTPPLYNRLPHLTFLSIDDQPKASDVIGPTPEAAWDATELASLVSCCPNLSTLHAISLLPGAHVSVLSQLTGLTFLRVWYGLPPDQGDAEVRPEAGAGQRL
jgi:hypothetical protein